MRNLALAALLLAAALQPAPAIALDPLSAQELSGLRAGEAPQFTVTNSQNVMASSSDNVIAADSVVSGGVSFSQNAFSGFSGVGNIVVNTGNNNAIQGTLSVTVVGTP
jgi:N-acetylglutamate synthase/N-acetylornithine aminotransferase